MITAVAFVVLAGSGAVARAEAGRRWNRHDGMAWGTLVVNISGSFLLGAIQDVAPPVLTALGVGGLGAYTTWSSFARDAVALLELRRLALAGAYIAATTVLSIVAAATGMALS